MLEQRSTYEEAIDALIPAAVREANRSGATTTWEWDRVYLGAMSRLAYERGLRPYLGGGVQQ